MFFLMEKAELHTTSMSEVHQGCMYQCKIMPSVLLSTPLLTKLHILLAFRTSTDHYINNFGELRCRYLSAVLPWASLTVCVLTGMKGFFSFRSVPTQNKSQHQAALLSVTLACWTVGMNQLLRVGEEGCPVALPAVILPWARRLL